MVTDLSHQSRRALLRDWVASKVAVHEDCDLVNMFLSSTSKRCFGLFHQIAAARVNGLVEFTNLAHSLGQMFRCFSKIQSVLGKYESLMQADLYRVASSFFRIALRLPSKTSLSCSFSRGAPSALVFVWHPDSLMVSGACLKYQVQYPSTVHFDQRQTLNTRFNNRRLPTSKSSIPSVAISVAMHLDF